MHKNYTISIDGYAYIHFQLLTMSRTTNINSEMIMIMFYHPRNSLFVFVTGEDQIWKLQK